MPKHDPEARTADEAAHAHALTRRRSLALVLGGGLGAAVTSRASAAPAVSAAAEASAVAPPAQAGACASQSPAQPASEPARRLHALFDRHWSDSAQRFPEDATWRGDHRHGDRLNPTGAQAEAEVLTWRRALIAEAEAIDPQSLTPTDQTSRDLFLHEQRLEVVAQAFPHWRHMGFGSAHGEHGLLPDLLDAMAVPSGTSVAQAQARLADWPRRAQAMIADSRTAAQHGWIQPAPVLQRTLAQMDAQLAPATEDGPFMRPFARVTDAAARGALAQAIERHVLPQQREMRRFIAEELMPRAPQQGGMGRYPGGAAVYQHLIEVHTTLAMSAEAVHAVGWEELQRVRRGMAEVAQRLGHRGDVVSLARRLDGPEHHFDSAEALLDGYRAMAKRFDAVLPRLFAVLPRTPYGVRAMPAFLGEGTAEYYSSPPEDGSEPGWFNANAQAFRIKPRWSQATMVAHETVPGHHLQWARARELTGLPAFRRMGGHSVFSEGWATYAETLGVEAGLYDTSELMFGHLQMQGLRAVRLIVDTGLHALGWSRERALSLLVAETAMPGAFLEGEVDRYLSSPGQALSYMIGQQQIVALRRHAEQTLGQRFDLRQFHNAVIDQGSVPMPVLRRQMAQWEAQVRALGA